MASTKDLKKRIGTVKNTQQTTRAMKMVSAAKLRRAQDAVQSQRPYARQILQLIRKVASVVTLPEGHEISRLVSPTLSSDPKKVVVVLVTSDRGLCAGFNSNIIKTFLQWHKQNVAQYGSIELAFVGRKGHDFFKQRKFKLAEYYSELGGKVTFAKAKTLANHLMNRYLTNEVDEVIFIYNEFKNAASQQVNVEAFLPLRGFDLAEAGLAAPASSVDYMIKPNPEVVLRELVGKNFAIQAFRILLESQAGEHGARMSAMENATKNAGEMIRKLTLQYNKQRQAGITKELLEIIAGSESQKG